MYFLYMYCDLLFFFQREPDLEFNAVYDAKIVEIRYVDKLDTLCSVYDPR